jgi:CO/xanthine dehydrogenase FAD-binding subunit
MIAEPRYRRPRSIDEATALLADSAQTAVVLGGGTMVTPMLTRGEVRPSLILDPRDLGLDAIVVTDDEIEIGARVTYADVLASDELRAALPLLQTVAQGITGGAQIRNQGTLGGSACLANPPSDVPACLVATDAVLRLRGSHGVRTVAAADFFVDARSTARRSDELLTEIVIRRSTRRFGYAKLKLSESSWPIATAVAALDERSGVGAITLGGVHRRPLRVEIAVATQIEEVVSMALDDPWDDVLAPAEYRRQVAPVVARRAWEAL